MSDPLCREHEDRGIGFSASKDYASALVEFQTAYARAPIPRLLINIGRSLFRLGQPRDALKYYERFSRAEPHPAPEIARKIQQYIAEAQAASAAAPDATELPGKRVQSAPQPAPITDVTRPASAPPPPEIVTRESAAVSRPAKGFPGGAGALLGAGAGLLIAGFGLGGGALSAADNVTSGAGAFDADLYARGQRLNQAAIALDVIGGAALATGVVWLGVWLSHRKPPAARAASLPGTLATRGSWE